MNKPDYLIERHPHGWLIKSAGPRRGIPMGALGELAPLFGKRAVMDSGIADALQAVVAVAPSNKASEVWRQEIEEWLAKDEPDPLLRWRRGTDTGMSSLTLYAALHPCAATREHVRYGYAPRDAADFGRCVRLLAKAPGWKARLSEVADAFPKSGWRELAAGWNHASHLYRERQHKDLAKLLQSK